MENEEIDLIEVIAKLWHRRKVIFRFILVCLIVGIAIAFILPRKYTAKCTLGLEAEDRTTRISVEGMSAFQSMNVGDIRNVKLISPSMYPDILFSVPFQKELIYSPLFVNAQGEKITFYNYLIQPERRHETNYTPASSGVERLTPEENECLGYLKNAITAEVNNKDGNLKISVDMPDAVMAAQLANKVQSMLQQYIAKFRIAKAQAALDFIEERYVEVKDELEKKQKGLIEFQEKYKSQNSIQLETEKKILTNDYELFFGLYSDIVKQRERARIQVKEDMPVLTVIEPVVEPTVPSKPHRALIILASAMIGLFLGCGTVLIQPFLAEIVSTKKSTPTIPIDRMKKIS